MKSNSLKHIAIIPDGNRRWARQQGRSPLDGHRHAIEKTLMSLYKTILHKKIPYCTFWALSTENHLKRSRLEMNNLYSLLRNFLQTHLEMFQNDNVKITVIGNPQLLPKMTQEAVFEAIEKTKNNTGLMFVFGLNYGGRDELVRAVRNITQKAIPVEKINQQTISDNLDTTDIPDPDVIIRTGGEKRLSGFYLWQCEYSELFFVDTLFPAFTSEQLTHIIDQFLKRNRRFGK